MAGTLQVEACHVQQQPAALVAQHPAVQHMTLSNQGRLVAADQEPPTHSACTHGVLLLVTPVPNATSQLLVQYYRLCHASHVLPLNRAPCLGGLIIWKAAASPIDWPAS
jgi:hypothetical protein